MYKSLISKVVTTALAIAGCMFVITDTRTPYDIQIGAMVILVYLGWTISMWKE